MANQSFAQVPVNLSDPVALKRLLDKIVIEIDLITGRRAGDPYVKSSDVTEEVVSLDSLNAAVQELISRLNTFEDANTSTSSAIEELSSAISQLVYSQEFLDLDATYADFNASDWGTLKGKGTFSALGSTTSNAPYALTAGTTYNFYADSAITSGGGVAQQVWIEEAGVGLRVFCRTGTTFANALTNGWTEL